jgi:triosephosphate isomerase
VFLQELTRLTSGKKLTIGAQNAFLMREGAYTGEISPSMLAGLKVKTVIIGHSERRAMGETDEQIGEKVSAALREGLTVILCVGESVRDHDGSYTRVITGQLKTAFASVQRPNASRLVIAYEPVWAIGKNAERPADPSDVVEVSILIKKVLADTYGQQIAEGIPILYGGSVDHINASNFLEKGNVRGLLVGRASLSAKSFGEILMAADAIETARRKQKRAR